MKALWMLRAATVHAIRSELLPDRPLAYTTVMTVMERLARKGMVDRAKQGRAHLYRPAIAEEAIRERALNQLVENHFQGSRDGLRHYLVRRDESLHDLPKKNRDGAPRAKTQAAGAKVRADDGLDTSLL